MEALPSADRDIMRGSGLRYKSELASGFLRAAFRFETSGAAYKTLVIEGEQQHMKGDELEVRDGGCPVT